MQINFSRRESSLVFIYIVKKNDARYAYFKILTIFFFFLFSAVMLLLALIILFLPVFLVLILPCILVVKCRELGKKSGNVRKITEDEVSDEAEAQPLSSSSKDEMELLATKNNGIVIRNQPEPKTPSLAEEV